jgi:ferric-dicitrate binding protein FerR (iron transport regulator)
MKIRTVGTEFRVDRRTDMTQVIVACRNVQIRLKMNDRKDKHSE